MASFEDQLSELEKVVEQLERGDLSLDESVSLFERGVHLSNACKAQLSSAESRIQVLLEPEEHGPVRVEELALTVADEEIDEEDEELLNLVRYSRAPQLEMTFSGGVCRRCDDILAIPSAGVARRTIQDMPAHGRTHGSTRS